MLPIAKEFFFPFFLSHQRLCVSVLTEAIMGIEELGRRLVVQVGAVNSQWI